MKNKILFFLLTLFVSISNYAQVVIGGSTPTADADAVLDVQAENKAILLPRVADVSSVTSPSEGMMVYDISQKCTRVYENTGVSGNNWSNCLEPYISALKCKNSYLKPSYSLILHQPSSSLLFVPYYDGNGAAFPKKEITSSNFPELTATLDEGILAKGNGYLTYKISGTPTKVGNALFEISMAGISCISSIYVSPASGRDSRFSAGYFNHAQICGEALSTIGYNGYGQSGDGTTTYVLGKPRMATGAGSSGVVGVAMGYNYSVILKSDGTVFCSGSGNLGQLGNGGTSNFTTFQQVSGINNAVSVSSGSYSGYAQLTDNTLMAWGYNGYGQLGDGSTTQRNTPVAVRDIGGTSNLHVSQIAVSNSNNGGGELLDGHVLAVTETGQLVAWGANSYHQLGDGTTNNRNIPVVVTTDGTNTFSPPAGIKMVAACGDTSYALTNDGKLYAWGYNGYGQLGLGNNINQNYPIEITSVSTSQLVPGNPATGTVVTLASLGLTVDKVFANAGRVFIVLSDSSLWSAGYGTYGSLLDGTNGDGGQSSYYFRKALSTIQPSGMTEAETVAIGTYSTLVRNQDGNLWTGGWADYGATYGLDVDFTLAIPTDLCQ